MESSVYHPLESQAPDRLLDVDKQTSQNLRGSSITRLPAAIFSFPFSCSPFKVTRSSMCCMNLIFPAQEMLLVPYEVEAAHAVMLRRLLPRDEVSGSEQKLIWVTISSCQRY